MTTQRVWHVSNPDNKKKNISQKLFQIEQIKKLK